MPSEPDRSRPPHTQYPRRPPPAEHARPALPPLLQTSSASRPDQPIPPLPPLRLLHSGLSPSVADAHRRTHHPLQQNQQHNRRHHFHNQRAQHTQQPLVLSGPLPPLASPPSWPADRTYAPSTLTHILSTLDEIGHSLDDANSHLRTLLDISTAVDLSLVNQLPSSDTMLSRPGGGSSGGAGSRREFSRPDEGSRLAKRRRLDSDKSTAPSFKGFRYGRYGQVEPGKLTMEIVSCDGGLYSDGGSYAAENILKSDNSVYCTKGNRCNIVLQHQGCTTFSLKELIIKAPDRNYSSPVRQGLVFFSMTKDELISTNQFQSEDVVPPVPVPQSQPPPGSSLDTLRVYNSARMTAERLANTLDPADPRAAADDVHGDDLYSYITQSYDDEPMLRPREPDRSYSSHFQVMTECSDDENDDTGIRYGGNSRGMVRGPWQREAGWSPTPLRSRGRHHAAAYEESPPYGTHVITWDAPIVDNYDDSLDADDYTELYELQDAVTSPPDSPRRAEEEEDEEEEDEEEEDEEGEHHDTAEADPVPPFVQYPGMSFQDAAVSGGYGNEASCPEVVTPYARFHIENNRTKCTIHFDPPVTARYILLKMWNPRQDLAGGNIDIQGVVAKGYAGPRYFPSLELR